MNFIIRIILSVSLLSTYRLALADDCAPIKMDIISGASITGASWLPLAGKFKESDNCVYNREQLYADCEFTSDTGVQYLAFGKILTRITFSRMLLADGQKYPFDISPSATINEVIGKLESQHIVAPLLQEHRLESGEKALITDYCFLNSQKALDAITIIFDEQDIIKSFDIRINW